MVTHLVLQFCVVMARSSSSSAPDFFSFFTRLLTAFSHHLPSTESSAEAFFQPSKRFTIGGLNCSIFFGRKKGLFRRHSAPVPLASRQTHSLWLPADPEKPVQLCSLYAKCQYFLFLPGGKLRTRFHTTHSSRGGRPMVEENRLLHFCVAAAASRGTFFSDGTDRLTQGARNNTHRKITMTFNRQNSPQFRVDPADGHCLTDTTGTDYRKTIFRARFFANFLPNFAI